MPPTQKHVTGAWDGPGSLRRLWLFWGALWGSGVKPSRALFRERTNSWQPCLQERGLHDLSTWTSGMSVSSCVIPGASYAHDWPPRPALRGSQHTHRAGCPRFGFFIFISAPTKFQPGGRKPNRASLNNDQFHRESVSGWAGFSLGVLIASCTANLNVH